MKKCCLYLRVSTGNQVEGFSLQAQESRLRAYAKAMDFEIVDVFVDAGASGKNIDGRTEFQLMMKKISFEKNYIDYVLVFKLSRFGRNAADVLGTLQIMQDFGVELICVDDGIDSSKDAGKLMISVLSSVAEIERENIRSQTMAGRVQKASNGLWNGGTAPYGYVQSNGKLIVDEDAAKVVKIIYDRYVNTHDGTLSIAKYLNENGFAKPAERFKILRFTGYFVRDILANPIYAGKIAYCRTKQDKVKGSRNKYVRKNNKDFYLFEGQHEAIVSEELWNAASEKLKANANSREKKYGLKHVNILTGLLKCPCCGSNLYGNVRKPGGKDRKLRFYYYCKNLPNRTGHLCSFRCNIPQEELNSVIENIIMELVAKDFFANALKKQLLIDVSTSEEESLLAKKNKELTTVLNVKERLALQMDSIDPADKYYQEKIKDLQHRYDQQYVKIENIQKEIDNLELKLQSIKEGRLTQENIAGLLMSFKDVYHIASDLEKKELLKTFLDRIELFPKKRQDGNWIKKLIFKFPIPVNKEKYSLEYDMNVETVALLILEK